MGNSGDSKPAGHAAADAGHPHPPAGHPHAAAPPHAAAAAPHAAAGAHAAAAGAHATAAPRPPAAPHSHRYAVTTDDDGSWVVCTSSPNLRLHVDPGLTITGAERKRYPRHSVFLDGVYAGPPFFDNDARQYSFDHHEGCVRAFTVATCEQAVIALMHGLPLDQGEWHVYMNQPDADAVLAAWVMFNHIDLLRDDRRLLRHVMPFVRLEGVIDAHGLDGEVLAALSPKTTAAWKAHLDALVAHEREARRSGAWSGNVLEFARAQLERLDAILLPADFLDRVRAIGAAEQTELDEDVLAVLCRSDLGIYEVEQLLQERHGRRVALIVLDLGGGHFTLRQTGAFLTHDLRQLYPVLNRRDPNVTRTGGSDRWGGSDEIGGSPRQAGSGLAGAEIMALLAKTYRRRGFWDWLTGR